MSDHAWQKWFEEIWAEREEQHYRSFFGDTGPGIYTLPASTFASLGCKDPDPRFLFHGVFECPPPGPANAPRDHYIYVTSGMSNAWGEDPSCVSPDKPSGMGFEFVLHTAERAPWAIKLLHWVMVVQLLVATEQLQGELLQRNDRIPLGGPLAQKEGSLTHLLVSSPASPPPSYPPLSYPAEFTIGSGRVELLVLIGITEREADFARTQDAEALLTLLCHHAIFPLTAPKRLSLV